MLSFTESSFKQEPNLPFAGFTAPYSNKTNQLNWYLLIPVAIALFAFFIFLIRRNQKDEKKLEEQLNNGYTKPKEDKNNVDAKDSTKYTAPVRLNKCYQYRRRQTRVCNELFLFTG